MTLGEGTVFERIEALFYGPPTAFFADEFALAAAVVQIKGEIDRIGSLPLETALREYLGAVGRLSGARLEALIARFGWGGRPPVTLEEAAGKLGITRERLRQIQDRIRKRMPAHQVVMPALDRALELLRANAPLTPEAGAALLAKGGVAGRPFHPLSVLEASRVCARTPTFEIAQVNKRALVVSNPLRGVANAIIQTANIQAGASGVSAVPEVAEECNQNGTKVTDSQVREVLQGLSDVQFLAEDWFWRPGGNPERNRLRNVSRKMLSVASPISIASLREGVRREYAWRRTRGSSKWRLVVPPRHVLEAFYRANAEFSVDEEGLVSPVEPLDYRVELNRTDQILVVVLRSSPTCLLDRAAFTKGCIDHGMNENTFSVYSSYGAIVEHLGTGVWTLRGVHVDPVAVEALRASSASRPRQRRIVDHGWTPAGSLWVAIRLPATHQRSVFFMPSAVRRVVEGREFAARSEDGSPYGTLRVGNEGNCWGFSQFLSRNGADEDDILVADFDLVNDSVTLRLVSCH
jgi:hypothetical protein